MSELQHNTGGEVIRAGMSFHGRDILAHAFLQAGAQKPTVMLLGQQHGTEKLGAQVLEELVAALSEPALAEVTSALNVIVLPCANPDGAAMGEREGLHGHDINRDHNALATPEARAIRHLMDRFRPSLVIDLHEFDPGHPELQGWGLQQHYDLLVGYKMPAPLAEKDTLLRSHVLEPVLGELARHGLVGASLYDTIKRGFPAASRGILTAVAHARGIIPLLLESPLPKGDNQLALNTKKAQKVVVKVLLERLAHHAHQVLN